MGQVLRDWSAGRVELHLKKAPKNDDWRRHRRANQHRDAAAGVECIEAFYDRTATRARIIKPLTETAWGTKDFYVEDPDGYILCFGGPAAD